MYFPITTGYNFDPFAKQWYVLIGKVNTSNYINIVYNS